MENLVVVRKAKKRESAGNAAVEMISSSGKTAGDAAGDLAHRMREGTLENPRITLGHPNAKLMTVCWWSQERRRRRKEREGKKERNDGLGGGGWKQSKAGKKKK